MEDHPRRSDGRRHCRLDRDTLDQLLGYLPLDYQDEYAVDTLALYSARYAYLVTWSVIELLTELAGGPVDLAELRIGFQEAARRSASTKSLSNRDRRPPGRSNGDAQGERIRDKAGDPRPEGRGCDGNEVLCPHPSGAATGPSGSAGGGIVKTCGWPVTLLADHPLSRRVVRRDLVDGEAVADGLVTVVAFAVDVVGVAASVSAASTAATAGGSGGSP